MRSPRSNVRSPRSNAEKSEVEREKSEVEREKSEVEREKSEVEREKSEVERWRVDVVRRESWPRGTGGPIQYQSTESLIRRSSYERMFQRNPLSDERLQAMNIGELQGLVNQFRRVNRRIDPGPPGRVPEFGATS